MGIVSSKLRNIAKGQDLPTDRRFMDLTGQRFGRLVVVSYLGRPSPSCHMWLCQCDCGNQKKAAGGMLRAGRVSSCNCLRSEVSAARFMTHGKTETVEYNSWVGMKGRCLNPENPKYERYGARVITVCDRWRDSFEAFFDDMGRRPTSEHSIDRIDNDGNYEPGNCRWATPSQQQRNRGGQRVWKGDR